MLAGTGRCWTGVCILGLTLDELADVARVNTSRKITVVRDLSEEQFREHLRRSNDPRRRYIVNFSRERIFGAGVGHHSPIGGYLEPEAERVKSELELRVAAAESGGVEEARKAVAASPDDLSLRLNLADALAAAGKSEEALEICLEVVKRDKGDAGAEAKATMLRIFGVLGPQSELASQYRRKLATALY